MLQPTPASAPPTLSPARWSSIGFAWSTAAAAWLLYLAVALVRCLVYGFNHPWMLMERHALTALIAVVMSGALFAGMQRLESANMRVRLVTALVGAVPPAALLSVINYNVMYVFAPAYYLRDMGMDLHASLLGEVIHSSVENYFVFATWAVLFTAVSHAVQTQELHHRAAASDAAARAAELRALRLQLNPHFLFNALNTISGLVLSGDAERAEGAIGALSEFLRTSLATDAAADIRLEEELRLQASYLEIEQIRFGERLIVETVVPEDLRGAMVPALILQPLIENSVHHAVSRSTEPVRIVVSAARAGSALYLTVADDGPGGSATPGHGVGLLNVTSRLQLRYDGNGSCLSGEREGGGFETCLTLPLRFAATRNLAA